MKYLSLCFMLMLCCSCHKSASKDQVNTLQIGDRIAYKLPNSEVLTIVVSEDGAELLYLAQGFRFSLHRQGDTLKTMGDVLGDKGYSILDLDGDFLPDIKMIDGKIRHLHYTESDE